MEQNKSKLILRLQILVTIACIISGLLAGENLYRYVIEVPAWRHLDIINWGEYSRNADLKNGVFLFPFEAIAETFLFIFSSVIVLKNKQDFKSLALTLHLLTFFSLTGLSLTLFAAPYMLSVRTIGNDPVLLQQTFNHFHFWGSLRAMAQVLCFPISVLVLGKIYELKFKQEFK
jgi:hypothetical protein